MDAQDLNTDIKLLNNLLTFALTFQPRCESSSVHNSPALFAKVKICRAEVWSSEIEVKLIKGHGGEVHSLTCSDDSPTGLAIFRDVTLGTSRGTASPGGSSGSIRSAEPPHNYSTPP